MQHYCTQRAGAMQQKMLQPRRRAATLSRTISRTKDIKSSNYVSFDAICSYCRSRISSTANNNNNNNHDRGGAILDDESKRKPFQEYLYQHYLNAKADATSNPVTKNATVPRGFWEDRSNHKLFFDCAASWLGIKSTDDWYSFTASDLLRLGGKTLISNYYGGSLVRALAEVYPDIEWHPWRFASVPQRFWQDRQNQRKFLEWAAGRLGIVLHCDDEKWYSTTAKDLERIAPRGSTTVRSLLSYYKGSLSAALMTLFPEFDWQPWRFSSTPQIYWKDPQNRRQFLEWIARKQGIARHEDWYKITKADLNRLLGGSCDVLISNHHFGGSLAKALADAYPEFEWHPWRFADADADEANVVPRGFWRKHENHRKYFDWVARELGVRKQPEDWYRISPGDVERLGAYPLLAQYYGNSLVIALTCVYPQLAWDPSRFEYVNNHQHHHHQHQQHPSGALEGELRKYVEGFLAQRLQVNALDKWYHISPSQIESLGGGLGLGVIKRHGGTLFEVLKRVYPNHPWDKTKFNFNNSNSQSQSKTKKMSAYHCLLQEIRALFPNQEILENYSPPELPRYDDATGGEVMTLDIFLPELALAFEYHGEYHFNDVYFFGATEESVFKSRDEQKAKACADIGISLVVVPHWWDRTGQSLAATIRALNRDGIPLPPPTDGVAPPIPSSPPPDHKLPAVRGFWNDPRTHRKFFDKLAQHLGIKRMEEWYNVTKTDLLSIGGGGDEILRHYSGSLMRAIEAVYPEHPWDITKRPRVPNGFWDSLDNQRHLFDNIARELGITSPDGWYGVTSEQFNDRGGSSVLIGRYGNSLYRALSAIYPEISWDPTRFIRTPAGFWSDLKNQRAFLDKIAKELNINNYDDWYNVTAEQVISRGGGSLIQQYGGALGRALRAVYPEHPWTEYSAPDKVPAGYWKDPNNHRLFFDKLAEDLRIRHWEEWYNVTMDDVAQKKGGASLVNSYYDGSLRRALQAVYPEHAWEATKFARVPNSYWSDLSNQRQLFERVGKEELKLKSLDDWHRVTHDHINRTKLGALVRMRYAGSLCRALQTLYPEHPWRPWSFPRLSSGQLTDEELLRDFMTALAKELNIQHLDDWYRVSVAQIKRAGGTKLVQSNGGLLLVLQRLYPHHAWDPARFNKASRPVTKSSQRLVCVALRQIFPDTAIVEDYHHPELVFADSLEKMQLDIYLPSLLLAFEYQGAQHYRDVHFLGRTSAPTNRTDEEKRAACRRAGITLVTVPYWWDHTVASLAATIHMVRPDLVPAPSSGFSPITEFTPTN